MYNQYKSTTKNEPVVGFCTLYPLTNTFVMPKWFKLVSQALHEIRYGLRNLIPRFPSEQVESYHGLRCFEIPDLCKFLDYEVWLAGVPGGAGLYGAGGIRTQVLRGRHQVLCHDGEHRPGRQVARAGGGRYFIFSSSTEIFEPSEASPQLPSNRGGAIEFGCALSSPTYSSGYREILQLPSKFALCVNKLILKHGKLQNLLCKLLTLLANYLKFTW